MRVHDAVSAAVQLLSTRPSWLLSIDGLKTESPLNGSQGRWRAAARLRKAQRESVYCAWYQYALARDIPPLPLHVVMVRVGPQLLDDDNLGGSLKSVRDEIAARLGIDDGDPRIVWSCEQVAAGTRGRYAVHMLIRSLPSEEPADA